MNELYGRRRSGVHLHPHSHAIPLPGGDELHSRECRDRAIRERFFQSLQWVAATVLVALMLGGCATRTVGMQAPLAHDYDGMQWRPLDATVRQQMIVAPGYSALVENDPGTDPETLVERIRALPDDVRSAELVEVRLALRPVQDRAFEPVAAVRTSVLEADEPAIVARFGSLRFEDDWTVITAVPVVFAGQTLEIVLEPAPGWEYGVTLDRVPYGGYSAIVEAGGGTSQALRGSLGFETVFEQSTDRSRLLDESVEPALWSAVTDPFLASVYVIILGLAGMVWFLRDRSWKAG